MQHFVVSRPSPRFLVRQPTGAEVDVEVVQGLRHPLVQSYDVFVVRGAASALHTVVVATEPLLSPHDREVIARALAATRRPELAFVEAESPDGADATCSEGADAWATAAAVAVVRASTGQSDANSMTISVNGEPRAVEIAGDGLRWQCRVG